MTIRKEKFNTNILKIGTSLRTLRKRKGLTIAQFAEKVDLSEKIISNYENGKNIISIESIIKIYQSKVYAPLTLTELFDILIIQIYEEND